MTGHDRREYPPLRLWAEPLFGTVLNWLELHARTTQIFFAVSGYVMARSMNSRFWDSRRSACFVLQRYCRLGLPYLAIVALMIPIYALVRNWLPIEVVGTPVTLAQFLAHLFFLQDILGFEQLSAGLWFVCINFQLSLVYVALLWLRDTLGTRVVNPAVVSGWLLAAYSLFHFNLHAEWDGWWLYFFPYFFVGVVVQNALSTGRSAGFWLYQLLLVAALYYEWRWRLVIAVLIGLVLFAVEKSGIGTQWPRSRVIAKLGQVSYSLFLLHFPVLLLTSLAWARMGWNTPLAAVTGLVVAFVLSILAALVFHRWVEIPSRQLAQSIRLGKRRLRIESLVTQRVSFALSSTK